MSEFFAGQIVIGMRTVLAKSCYICHAFKDESEFYRYSNGRIHAACKTCFLAQTNRLTKASNDRTVDSASNSRAAWGNEELRTLQVLLNRGLRHEEIAIALNRTRNGINYAICKYGVRKRRVYLARPGRVLDTDFIHNYIQEMVA